MKKLINNINKVHTTNLGLIRINKNLELKNDIDTISFCKDLIKKGKIYKEGKNYYCEYNNIKLTINSYSYTIITAHRIKENK